MHFLQFATGLFGRGGDHRSKGNGPSLNYSLFTDNSLFSDVAERLKAWDRVYDQSLQYIEANEGKFNVYDASREDPRLALMGAIEEDARTLDQLLVPKVCQNMDASQAWQVLEFLKSARAYMDQNCSHMFGDAGLLRAAHGTESRFLNVEEEILRKMIRPLVQEISQDGLLAEIRGRNFPSGMQQKIENLYDMYAFIGGHVLPDHRL